MINKKILLTSICLIFFLLFGYGKTALRDELPSLKLLSDFAKGEKRIKKAIKYESKGKYKKAKKLYSEALENFLTANEDIPASPEIYYYLGFISKKLKKMLDAEIYYLLGVEIDPNNIRINSNLSKLYIEMNRLDEAKNRLKVLKNCKCKEYEELKNLVK
jgi:tetratricopeptide (TPR) repeat protein